MALIDPSEWVDSSQELGLRGTVLSVMRSMETTSEVSKLVKVFLNGLWERATEDLEVSVSAHRVCAVITWPACWKDNQSNSFGQFKDAVDASMIVKQATAGVLYQTEHEAAIRAVLHDHEGVFCEHAMVRVFDPRKEV